MPKGTEAMGNKQEIGKLLSNPGSYPVRVSYFPHPAFKFVRPGRVPDIEVARTPLKFVQDALAELDGNIDNVKHTLTKGGLPFSFWGMLNLLWKREDHYFQTGDDLQDALEWEMLVQKYGPHMEGYFLLTKKTGPGQELPPSKFEGGAKLGKPNEAHRTTMGRSMCWNTSLVDSMLYLFRPKLAAQFPSISRAAGTRGSSSELMPEDTAAEMPGQESWN
ncbi:RFC5 [Symbiodinium natans]|uniref:RFC5 protein n=1 Tax=Symbiodinium natans TaxID=878477 RepID=A0A812MNF2_9DINO|nr:RFC5 [Symbiodinium natans]